MSSKADRSEKRFTKAEKSWIMYDWANSIYATNIMAAIFPIYFAMQANETGNKLYGFAVSAAALVVAVLAPILGAIGDFSGMKKKLFAGFLVLGLVFTAVMAAYRTAEPTASAMPVSVPSGSVPPSSTPETSTMPHAASPTQTSCRHVSRSWKTNGEARISMTGAV